MTLLVERPDRAEHDAPAGGPALPPAPRSPRQGVIEQARARHRRRRACATLALVALAGLAAALGGASGGAGDRRPVHRGRTRAGAGGAATRAAGGGAFSVSLSPALAAGEPGWCSFVRFGSGGAGGCATSVPAPGRPLFGGVYFADGRSRTGELVMLTTPQVAYVEVNHARRVPTRSFPGLPYGIRAVAIAYTARRGDRGAPLPPRPDPQLTPLDARGHRIAQLRIPPVLMRSRTWESPRPQARGACTLGAPGIAGLAPVWGSVVISIHAVTRAMVGRAFTSCARTEYRIGRFGYETAMLLDAAKPASSPPAAIPGLSPLPGHPGVWAGSSTFRGYVLARRQGDAWLLVAGGGPQREATRLRLLLLRHLRGTITGAA